MNNIGENILRIAKEKSITQQKIADTLGISKSTVCRWEHNGGLPTIDLLPPLCNVLDCYPSDILGTDESSDIIVINKDSDEGRIISKFLDLPGRKQACVEGYIDSFMDDGFTRRMK